jgi:hypothetical protein
MNEKHLHQLYVEHSGKVSDKWSLYLTEYDRLFDSYRSLPVRLLEIGVQNGGSLEIWLKYFKNAAIVIGCDVDPSCSRLNYDDQRIVVVIGDANTLEVRERVFKHGAQFDIVIDDGSHRSSDIVKSFAMYFSSVVEGGVFVVEDLHCSYWREFEGGLADPFSAIAFFKRLADLINHEHWGVPVDRSTYLAGFAAYYGCQFDIASLAQVHSVEFINSMCVIRKRAEAKNMLGKRLIAGKIDQVSAVAQYSNNIFSTALDQSGNAWSAPQALEQMSAQSIHAAELEKRVTDLSKAVDFRDRLISQLATDKEHEAREHQAHMAELSAVVQSRDTQVATLMAALRSRDAQVATLMAAQNSLAARLARLAERNAKRIFPAGSMRWRLLVHGLTFAERVYRHRPTKARRQLMASGGASEFAQWIQRHEPREETLQQQRDESASYDPQAPLFSVILPVYKVPQDVLSATLTSVRCQTWQNWEACVVYADLDNAENWALLERFSAEDPRIRIRKLTENLGISSNSNAALEFARGEYIALLDHDDELTPWALHDMARKITECQDVDFLYSDKDSIDASGSLRLNPLFKPQWSPEILYSANYLTHLTVMRRTLVQDVGGWQPETDGAQDWDIFLRVSEKSRRIERVPGIHYHWRIIAGSTATGISAKPYAALGQLRTLEGRVRRLGLAASVVTCPDSGFRLVWHLEARPYVDLILHGMTSSKGLTALLDTILVEAEGTLASVSLVTGPAFDASAVPERLPGGIPVRVLKADNEIAMTAAIDEVGRAGNAPVVLLLDLAITRLAKDTLRDLVGWALLHPEISFVSALVLLEDDTVVEAGRVVGEALQTLPLFRSMPLRHYGPLGGPLWYRNVSSASATAVAFKRDVWRLGGRVGLSWPQAFAGCCADALTSGRRGMVTPHARVYLENLPEEALCDWHDSFRADPFFHPAFGSLNPLAFGTV